MICNVCHVTKPESEFTKVNRSKDGTKGLCKECKSKRDAEYYERLQKRNAKLEFFELTTDLLTKRKRARIGVLNLVKFTDREQTKNIASVDMTNFGLNAILKELDEPYEYCNARTVNDYEFILISLTSSMDVENLIYTFEAFAPSEVKAKVIVGGFGVININLIKTYIDIACFGRCEGQINDILADKRLSNVWRKEDDPELTGEYEIRQAQYLVDGECAIGCRHQCGFCQYTYTRRPMKPNQLYRHGKSTSAIESEWAALEVSKAGSYTTAWDGWSDETRRKVLKPVTDSSIRRKLIEIGTNKDIDGGINLKVFQIVGYPWETKESVLEDIYNTNKLLREIDSNIYNNITLVFYNTPFSPEPLTPMQYDASNIYINWRDVLNFKYVYNGKRLKGIISPMISGSYTLMKRTFINRATVGHAEMFKRVVFNSMLGRMNDKRKMDWLLKHGAIDERLFGEIDSLPYRLTAPR